jgi:hypothetical protein
MRLEDRVAKVASYNEGFVSGLRDSGQELQLVDDDKVNEFANLWRSPDEQVAKSAFIDGGRRGIEIELQSLGFSQPTVEVAAKDNNFVVFAAEVGTRKGRVPFLVPAEIKSGSVLMPSVFVSGDEFKDLTLDNIKSHVISAEASKQVSPQAVLSTLNRLTGKTSNQNKVSVASDDGQMSFASPELFMDPLGFDQPVADIISDRADPVAMPAELVGLSQDMIHETLVEAGLSFDRETVLAAKKVVSNELRLAKISHDTIKVASEFNGGITLVTNVSGRGGKKKIEVPVEVVNGYPLIPGSFTSGAFAASFDEAGLQSFANQAEGAAFDPFISDKYGMSFDQLHKMALRKAAYGDFIEATEVLTVINEKFGHDFHRIAHDDLIDLLKIGYGDEEKPMTAMERFAADASAKAKDKESQIRMTTNSMLFYPKE